MRAKNWRCRWFGHQWYATAENPAKSHDGEMSIFSCTCRRRCGVGGILTIWRKPYEWIAFHEQTKNWTPENGSIPSWAKIIIN